MGSTRLPGKVLQEVLGRPLLSYQIERLRGLKKVEKIIIATTVNKEDDPIVQLCTKESIPCFRGSEKDVLDRYYQSAQQYHVDPILRITSDCPLLDPEVVEQVIKVYGDGQYDYVRLDTSFAEGLGCEVFSFSALELAHRKSVIKSEREHVTLYMNKHPELMKKFIIKNISDDSKYRFTVDEPEDFEVVKAIIEALYKKKSVPFNAGDIKKFLDNHPEIYRINKHIIRNEGLAISLKNDGVMK